jgi:hypothetical protein
MDTVILVNNLGSKSVNSSWNTLNEGDIYCLVSVIITALLWTTLLQLLLRGVAWR